MTKFFFIHDKILFFHDKILFLSMTKFFFIHDNSLFYPWQNSFFPWQNSFLSMTEFVFIHDKIFLSMTKLFFPWQNSFSHDKTFLSRDKWRDRIVKSVALWVRFATRSKHGCSFRAACLQGKLRAKLPSVCEWGQWKFRIFCLSCLQAFGSISHPRYNR